MLREGLYDVAAQLAAESNCTELVDVDLFTQARVIMVRELILKMKTAIASACLCVFQECVCMCV